MKKIWLLFSVISVALLVIASTIILGINNISMGTTGEVLIANAENSGNLEGPDALPEQAAIPLSELLGHNTDEDCWVIYKTKIYDLTSWLARHPGGIKTILPYCGTQNFEEAFTRMHGTSKSEMFMKVAIYMGDLEEVN